MRTPSGLNLSTWKRRTGHGPGPSGQSARSARNLIACTASKSTFCTAADAGVGAAYGLLAISLARARRPSKLKGVGSPKCGRMDGVTPARADAARAITKPQAPPAARTCLRLTVDMNATLEVA